MENAVEDETDVKQSLVITENQLCRCCLCVEKPMMNASSLNQYFRDLAGIDVQSTDGLPQWICYECGTLLKKSAKFKYKMLRAQTMLYEYVTRCAPFPIDASDPEIAKYSSPHLCLTDTLLCDNNKKKQGFHKVLEHTKKPLTSDLENIDLGVLVPINGDVDPPAELKNENTSDYEDDLPLLELRSNEENITEEPEIKEEEEPTNTETEDKEKKDTKVKTKKSKKIEENTEVPKRKSIRKPIELDENKIKVITLNPEEQFKQREQESKESLKFPYQCHLCFKGFNFEIKLQNHMSKHSPSRGKYKCTLCHMHLPTAHSYSVHSLIHTRRYECRVCAVRMIDRASIAHHYRTQHEGITTVFTCHLCGKVSSNNKTHRGHMRNHHSGERPKCDQCGKSFVNKDSLTEHMQIHLGVKNYECSVCGKKCRTRTQVIHHQLKHSNAKDYYCVECDVRFKSAANLRQHLMKSLKHKDVDSFKYSCPSCPRRYEHERSLTEHILIQHEGARPHACPCGATLASRAGLAKHAARHDLPRVRAPRHVCHTCGKAFTAKSVLINHIRTHTGEKPFPCATCGRRFTQRTAMTTHMRRVHRRTDKVKTEPAAPCKPAAPAYKQWPRPEELFYVTAGP